MKYTMVLLLSALMIACGSTQNGIVKKKTILPVSDSTNYANPGCSKLVSVKKGNDQAYGTITYLKYKGDTYIVTSWVCLTNHELTAGFSRHYASDSLYTFLFDTNHNYKKINLPLDNWMEYSRGKDRYNFTAHKFTTPKDILDIRYYEIAGEPAADNDPCYVPGFLPDSRKYKYTPYTVNGTIMNNYNPAKQLIAKYGYYAIISDDGFLNGFRGAPVLKDDKLIGILEGEVARMNNDGNLETICGLAFTGKHIDTLISQGNLFNLR